jgi:hypothetical protein
MVILTKQVFVGSIGAMYTSKGMGILHTIGLVE